MQTRRYKSMIAVFLTFLLILAPTVHAEDNAGTSPGTITAITDSDGLPLENSYAVTVPAGESELLDELLWKLLRVYATVEGETEMVTLNVDWDYNSLTSGLDTPGEYTHTASILADGYSFADGIPKALSIIVTVTEAVDEAPATIQSFDGLGNRYAYAVARNSDWQDFWDSYMSGGIWTDIWPCYTAEGETLYADIHWENPEPDMSQTGIVTLRGAAVLPENAVLSEGLTLPTVEAPVSIQSEPTLDCWCADADVIYIPWVMGDLDYDSLQFLASVNGGEWEDAGEWMDTNSYSVCVWIDGLEEGSTYQFKVVWDGGETNVFEFTWNGAVTDAGPVEGDRDTGDTGGNPANDFIQSAPDSQPETETDPETNSGAEAGSEPETDNVSKPEAQPETGTGTESEAGSEPEADNVSKPEARPETSTGSDPKSGQEPDPDSSAMVSGTSAAASKEPFFEEATDTYSLLSGTRLRMMREAGAVRFSKQGITITLSDAALDAMALTDDSRFFIELERTEQGFVLNATLDGVPLTALPDTLVLLPVTLSADNGKISLQNEQGESVCEGSYDPEMGIASFTIQMPGRYTIVETPGQSTPASKAAAVRQPSDIGDASIRQMSAGVQESGHSWLFLPVAALSLAGLATGLFLKRRWRR